jgi:hypothetical protein
VTKAAKFQRNSRVSEKPKKKHRPLMAVPDEISRGWMVAGFDLALSSIAGAAIAYDAITKRFKGPAFVAEFWTPDDDYFDRLVRVNKAQDFILDLSAELGVLLPYKDIVVAVEEPFPAHGGFTKRGISVTLKQQAELSGAFLSGLLRAGFTNVMQISNQHWRSLVASNISAETGEDVTTYPAKWQSGTLSTRFNCTPKDSGKFRAQQWAQDIFEPWIAQQGGSEIPDYPPMIKNSKKGEGGKKPRPADSKAKAFQPDDRFDALAIMEYARVEADLAI